MPDRDNILDVEFDAQMQGLFQQAERAIGQRAAVAEQGAKTTVADEGFPGSLAIEKENQPAEKIAEAAALAPDEAAAEFHSTMRGLDAVSESIRESVQTLPKAVADLRALLEMKNGVSHSMFSALHEELKSYKDGFLLQSVYRPIIRDLVSIYDDLTEIHRQISDAIGENSGGEKESAATKAVFDRMRTMEMNLGHSVEFILEVLARLDVTRIPVGSGKLDKCSQRAVAVEPTENSAEDTFVVRVVKRGFLWHERVLRPEEVVVKRFRDESRNTSPSPLSVTGKSA